MKSDKGLLEPKELKYNQAASLASPQACKECYCIEIPSVPLCLGSSPSSVSAAREEREAALQECQPRGRRGTGCESPSPARKKICWNEIPRDTLRFTLEKLWWEERLRAGPAQAAERGSVCLNSCGREQGRWSQGRDSQYEHLWKFKKSCLSTGRFLLRGCRGIQYG